MNNDIGILALYSGDVEFQDEGEGSPTGCAEFGIPCRQGVGIRWPEGADGCGGRFPGLTLTVKLSWKLSWVVALQKL